MMTDILLTRQQVEERTGLARSSIYRLMRTGRFPEPRRIGDRAVRWSSQELEAWLSGRPRRGLRSSARTRSTETGGRHEHAA